jgi:hypothetical protein
VSTPILGLRDRPDLIGASLRFLNRELSTGPLNSRGKERQVEAPRQRRHGDVEGNIVGIDPHKHTLSATVLDQRGGFLATEHFEVSGEGHRALEQ